MLVPEPNQGLIAALWRKRNRKLNLYKLGLHNEERLTYLCFCETYIAAISSRFTLGWSIMKILVSCSPSSKSHAAPRLFFFVVSSPWCYCGWSPCGSGQVWGAGTLLCWWPGCSTHASRPCTAAGEPGRHLSGEGPQRSPYPQGCCAPVGGGHTYTEMWGLYT